MKIIMTRRNIFLWTAADIIKSFKGETPQTNAEYMRRCKNDEELAEAIYKCVTQHPWSFNKEVILNWLKEVHKE